jgi:hypothetical protein
MSALTAEIIRSSAIFAKKKAISTNMKAVVVVVVVRRKVPQRWMKSKRK